MFRSILLGLFSLVCVCAPFSGASAEIYPNIDEPTRFHIAVPKGHLKDLLRWSPSRVPMVSPHRGGPMPGYPENALETLENATKYGPAILEVDVATLQDGTIVLMHDYTLDRTTTGTGQLHDTTWQTAKSLNLRDKSGKVTPFRIPRLSDALMWAKGRAILNLDIKRGTDFSLVMDLVRKTDTLDHVMAITYSVKQAVTFNRIAPQMMLSVRIRSTSELQTVKNAGIPLNRVVAWAGRRLLDPAVYRMLHNNGIMVMQGTLGFDDTSLDHQIMLSGNDSQYLAIVGRGADIIATDRHWAAQKAIRFPALVYFLRGKARSN
ncbi:MAG: glycerophosphodiester phosphodiesterase family protein [Kordiimonadaceae bacterium]|nr:glycerophosphodiester phosphodiesterase family protein [Kordiimonadaceae bacterium]